SVFAQRIQPFPSLIEVNTPESPDKDIPKAIVGGRLIDGLGNKAVEDAVIIIQGNRILHVGAADQIDIPEGAEIINAEGMTVLPGLIDAHLHTINNNAVLNTFLRNGVTTMRDPGHPFRFYQSIKFAEE